jgi:hypothetical protein
MAGGTFESDTAGTFQTAVDGTFVSATGGTFETAIGGTFESDTGGTFAPLLSYACLPDFDGNGEDCERRGFPRVAATQQVGRS